MYRRHITPHSKPNKFQCSLMSENETTWCFKARDDSSSQWSHCEDNTALSLNYTESQKNFHLNEVGKISSTKLVSLKRILVKPYRTYLWPASRRKSESADCGPRQNLKKVLHMLLDKIENAKNRLGFTRSSAVAFITTLQKPVNWAESRYFKK